MKDKISAIIIARSSTDRHDVSCKSQISEISAEVKKRGEFVYKAFEFPRIKHSDFLEDPEFKDILSEAKDRNRKWNKIWFYDTSRLSRNRLRAQTTKAFFRKHGIEIEFLKIPRTGEEALDNVVEGILETFDQLLSDFSRAGSIRGQKQNIRSGYRAGGFAPFGYRLKKHKVGINGDKEDITKSTLEPHPVNFPIIKEYLHRRSNGESRRTLINDFKKRKIKSPSGKDYWTTNTFNSIENNLLVYCGHLVYNRHNKKIDGKYIAGQKYRPEEEWEIKENTHEPAITTQEANAIKKQIQLNKRTKNTKPRKYLLTGILKCGICKGPMVGDSGFYTCINKRKHIKNCTNNNIVASFIDKKSISFVKEMLLTKVHFENIINVTKKSYMNEIMKTSGDISRIKNRIKIINNQISKHLELYERGNISPELIEQRIKVLESEKSDLEDSIDDNNQFLTAIKVAESDISDTKIKIYINNFEDLLNDSNIELMRDFINTFISKIEIWGKEPKKKKRRKVHVHGQIPAFSRIELVLPRGVEPLSPP
jgi:site-specific DNA recombinase